jgi:hypothetical protein
MSILHALEKPDEDAPSPEGFARIGLNIKALVPH